MSEEVDSLVDYLKNFIKTENGLPINSWSNVERVAKLGNSDEYGWDIEATHHLFGPLRLYYFPFAFIEIPIEKLKFPCAVVTPTNPDNDLCEELELRRGPKRAPVVENCSEEHYLIYMIENIEGFRESSDEQLEALFRKYMGDTDGKKKKNKSSTSEISRAVQQTESDEALQTEKSADL
jgi:hypothetical protein